jgi:hypothetical protein
VNSENDEADQQHTSEQSPQPPSSSQSDSSPVADQPVQQEQTDAANDPHYQRRHYRVQLAAVIVGICVMVIYTFQLTEMRKSTNAATRAANSAEQGLALTRENLDLTSKNVALSQKSTELNQKTIELTQRSLEATQEALKYASKANEISEKQMEAANAPWIDVSINDVSYKRSNSLERSTGMLPPAYGVLGTSDAKGRISNNTVEISYSVQNHSDAPAPRVYSECFLENAKGYMDRELSDPNSHAIMPHQTMNRRASLLAVNGDPKAVVNQINDAKVGIRVSVLFYSAIGKKNSFVETFYKIDGKFIVTNTEFNPSESEIMKMIHESTNLDPKKP